MKTSNHIVVSCLIVFGLFTKNVFAQHFTSTDYIIDWGNFNMTSGQKNSTNYSLTDSVGQLTPGLFSQNGYVLKSGFQYIYDTFTTFSFAISNMDINFGELSPGVGATATNTLTITTPSGHGYEITAQENHPLSLDNGTTIPDTPCDSGCTTSLSRPWTDFSHAGFGFNAQGDGTSAYFTDNTYYRPFAFSPATPQIFMSENSPVKNHQATITYQIAISPLQSAGTYHNFITYTAIPKY